MSVKFNSDKGELLLKTVEIKNKKQKKTTELKYYEKKGNSYKPIKKNYYRANLVFGDIASKKEEYPDQTYQFSALKAITKSTKEVEDVIIKIESTLGEKDRDAQAYDIAAKVAGVGGFKIMNGSDAYKMFLEVNADDFIAREVEFKGKTETKHFLDSKKSDGKITVFSSEIINNKEFLAIRDKKGVVHYYDMENGLKEEKLDTMG